jgi:hypothetical protein
MKKTLGLAAAAAVILPIALPAAAMADSPSYPSQSEQIPSLDAAFRTFNQGGAEVGGGAAKLVSGAVVGAPQVVTALPYELVGPNAPAPGEYVGPDTGIAGPMLPGN